MTEKNDIKKLNKMKERVYDFLEKHRHCDDNIEGPTHLSYGLFNGKFYLDKTQRKEFIEIAKKKGYKIKIIYLDIPFEICNHLNNYRVEKGEKDKINIITYRTMIKNFEEPTYTEGEIIRLNKIYNFVDKDIYNYKFT